MRKIVVDKNGAGRRVDQFLRREMPALPKSLLYRALRKGKVKLEGKKAKPDARVSEGDTLLVYLEDNFFAKEPSPMDFLHAPRALNVIFEDENILILDKPSGLLCHADDREFTDTLIARIQRYLYEKGEFVHDGGFTPALANRIDRNTSGLVMAAKNAETLRVLNEKIKMREIEKHYLCLVHGEPPEEFSCDNYLLKNAKTNTVQVFEKPHPSAKTAHTQFRRVEQKGGCALLEANLITGRTHQIRAQLAHVGYPIVGDGKYGKVDGKHGRRQCLCAYKLRFAFSGECALGYLNGLEFFARDAWFLCMENIL